MLLNGIKFRSTLLCLDSKFLEVRNRYELFLKKKILFIDLIVNCPSYESLMEEVEFVTVWFKKLKVRKREEPLIHCMQCE